MKTEEEKKTSRKWTVTIWCAILLTLIIIAAIISAIVKFELPQWVGTIGVMLAGEMLGYIGVNVWQKKIQQDGEQ